MGKTFPRVWLFLLLAPALWLAPVLADPGQIHAAPGAAYTDLAITHLPNAEFVRRTLADWGEMPLWNPHILGGTPFAGDPLSGLYYPPLWLAILLPPALAFNLLFLLHLVLTGLGAYRLAREEGIPPAGALLAGIAFGGMPKLIAHTAAGHLTLLLAAAWTPWLLLAAGRAAQGGGIRRWAGAGALAGIICLADPRWALPASLTALAYASTCMGRGISGKSILRQILHTAGRVSIFILSGLGIAAILLVPMAEFVSLSTRASMQPADTMTLSLPPMHLLGLLFSGLGGSMEWVVYPGAVIFVLAVFSFFPSSPRVTVASETHGSDTLGDRPPIHPTPSALGEMQSFWIFLFLIALLLSLGSNIPILSDLLVRLPGVGLLRVPPRWMFLAGLALAMLAGKGLAKLESSAQPRPLAAKIALGLAVLGAVWAVVSFTMQLPPPVWIGGGVIGVTGLLIFLAIIQPAAAVRMGWILTGLAVFDLALVDISMLNPNPYTASPDAAQVAAVLADQGDGFRVYSPSAAIPQDLAVQYGLRLLDGINPLMLTSTAETVSQAARVPMNGYSVTLPAFTSGNPEMDNAGVIPDWELLGKMNVRFVVSSAEIPSAMAGASRQIGSLYVYENLFFRPRAWVANGAESWDDSAGAVQVESDGPNRLTIRADGPGLIVVSEAAYPGWRATVDDEPAELRTVGGWWRAVEIGPGAHAIRMWMEPAAVWIGLAVTLCALAALAGVGRWAK